MRTANISDANNFCGKNKMSCSELSSRDDGEDTSEVDEDTSFPAS